MEKYTYRPKGVCTAQIDFEIEDGIVKKIQFHRGCSGNTQGVARLAEGMPVEEVIRRLKGTDCNGRGTSCPDQLARALEASLQE
ncbi:MAG: TIGR03905 family TSCPD domain-containing protein [Ruminococcaceae bacterium]|nr:TIGR03905 family TSCPD domain-containing protein [Oscillospiraceae bacterium]